MRFNDLIIVLDENEDGGRLSLSIKQIVSIVTVILLVTAAIILLTPPTKERRMKVDGSFEDWSGRPMVEDPEGDQILGSRAVDLLKYAVYYDDSYLFFYVHTDGLIFSEETTLRLFIDADGNPDTGYDTGTLGAEYLIEVYGLNGRIKTSKIYERNPQFKYNGTRSRDDWRVWENIGKVKVAMDAHRVEGRANIFDLEQAIIWVHIATSRGEWDQSDHVISMQCHGMRIDVVPYELEALHQGENEIAELRMTAARGTEMLTSLTFRYTGRIRDLRSVSIYDEDRLLSKVTPSEVFTIDLPSPLRVTDMTTLNLVVNVEADAIPGDVCSLILESATCSSPVLLGERSVAAYVESPPSGVVIDGLFAEWQKTVVDPKDRDLQPNLDILHYKAEEWDAGPAFYLDLRGNALQGSPVPRWIAKDTGQRGSRRSDEISPPLVGNDIIYIFLGSFNTSSGFTVSGTDLLVTHMVEIQGRGGEVKEATLYVHEGDVFDWSWTPLNNYVEAKAYRKGLEAAVEIDLQIDLVLFWVVDWSGEGDQSEITGLDPFAITLNGTVYQSATGENWTLVNRPVYGLTYVDISAGRDDLNGYVYALTNDGRIYFTSSAIGGWYRYGYGLPSLPSGASYVAIATGSGSTAGYIYVLRSDGAVFVTDSGVGGWYRYGYASPFIPSSHAYVDITVGSGTTSGCVYVLSNNGSVFISHSSVSGWYRYGYKSPPLPESTSYVAIGTSRSNPGYIYVLNRNGTVYLSRSSVDGWRRYGYGTPSVPPGSDYVDLCTGSTSGYVYVLRTDGEVYVTRSGVDGWYRYGTGDPEIPPALSYVALSGGNGIYALRNTGIVYYTPDSVSGWYEYGTGTPNRPSGGHAFVDIAADTTGVYALMQNGSLYRSTDGGYNWSHLADGGSGTAWTSLCSAGAGALFALRSDGSVVAISGLTGSTSFHSDAGTGDMWVSIASDGTYLYALRADGVVAYSTISAGSWSSKGDAGSDTSWVSIAAFPGVSMVYTMRNDRTVVRSATGPSSSWDVWATSQSDSSWVSIACDSSYVYALRSDGRVEIAPITSLEWTFTTGQIEGEAYSGLDTVISEFAILLLPLILLLCIGLFRRQKV